MYDLDSPYIFSVVSSLVNSDSMYLIQPPGINFLLIAWQCIFPVYINKNTQRGLVACPFIVIRLKLHLKIFGENDSESSMSHSKSPQWETSIVARHHSPIELPRKSLMEYALLSFTFQLR